MQKRKISFVTSTSSLSKQFLVTSLFKILKENYLFSLGIHSSNLVKVVAILYKINAKLKKNMSV